MHPTREALASCVSGISCLIAYGAGLIVLDLYPPAAGHKSAAFSDMGGLLLLLSTLSFVLGLAAIGSGASALGRLADDSKNYKSAAWVGVGAGATYVAISILPVVFYWIFK